MNLQEAKQLLDKVISKSRVHFYKPIQIAEILYRDRVRKDIDLSNLESYRNPSKKWRDEICLKFLGRTSTSSARYQDDIFNENAIPPNVLEILGQENREKNGIVESYIYKRFSKRFSQVSNALAYFTEHNKNTFQLSEFIGFFWEEPGLRRSIDKIYEIIVFSLFSAITEAIELSVEISYNPDRKSMLTEFQDFVENVLNLGEGNSNFKTKARIYRAGVTNAADKGLDMWANFGLAIQIKHLSLSEELAENIVGSITADRIVIVCKNAEQKVIVSLLNQIGWKARIQAIVTETDLLRWYEKALRGKHSELLGNKILEILIKEIQVEFPVTENHEFENFYKGRGYDKLNNKLWKTN